MGEVAKVETGFDAPVKSEQAGAMIGAAREMQQVQAMVLMAKKFPRDEGRCVDNIVNACTRPKLAETALYQYSKGGANISGPSIRLAENIAKCWHNIDWGVSELSNEGGESTMQAFAWDLETNVRVTKTFIVKHGRFKKGYNGNAGTVTSLLDPRDIYENNANNAARRVRACILGLIPQDVIETAVKQIDATQSASEDTSKEAIKTMVKAFKDIGVSQGMIEDFLQRKIDAMTPALKIRLRNIYASLKDGMSKVDDWFKVEGASIDEFKKPDDKIKKSVEDEIAKAKEAEVSAISGGVDSDDFDKATK